MTFKIALLLFFLFSLFYLFFLSFLSISYTVLHGKIKGRGGGESWNREKVRGATVHRAGSKVPTWLTASPFYKLWETPAAKSLYDTLLWFLYSYLVHDVLHQRWPLYLLLYELRPLNPYTVSTVKSMSVNCFDYDLYIRLPHLCCIKYDLCTVSVYGIDYDFYICTLCLAYLCISSAVSNMTSVSIIHLILSKN